jgi:hypothetical protein
MGENPLEMSPHYVVQINCQQMSHAPTYIEIFVNFGLWGTWKIWYLISSAVLPKEDEIIGGSRKLHNEELHKLYSSLNTIKWDG